MTGNTIWDNQVVIETGTDGTACSGNVFTRNIAWGGNNKALVTPSGPIVAGVILRCGDGMLIANNVFEDMDYWVFDITTGGGFAGSINGFRIVNNIIYQLASKIYAIETALPADAVIDNNVTYNSPGGAFASVPGNGNVPDLATFRALTGQESHGRFGDPLFANLAGQDFHLSPGSPALDAGTPIAGVTDGFSAPRRTPGRTSRAEPAPLGCHLSGADASWSERPRRACRRDTAGRRSIFGTSAPGRGALVAALRSERNRDESAAGGGGNDLPVRLTRAYEERQPAILLRGERGGRLELERRDADCVGELLLQGLEQSAGGVAHEHSRTPDGVAARVPHRHLHDRLARARDARGVRHDLVHQQAAGANTLSAGICVMPDASVLRPAGVAADRSAAAPGTHLLRLLSVSRSTSTEES